MYLLKGLPFSAFLKHTSILVLEIGNVLMSSDHPSNKKRGGVVIYYKKLLNYLSESNYLNESIFELQIGSKICNFQPNLVMDAGVHLRSHTNCHHKRVHAKFNLKIQYLPPYERFDILKKLILILLER